MKTLLMLATREGAPDGIHTQWYVEGETYVVPDYLAEIFVKEEWAEEVEPSDPDDHPSVNPEPTGSKSETTPDGKKEYSPKKGRKK